MYRLVLNLFGYILGFPTGRIWIRISLVWFLKISIVVVFGPHYRTGCRAVQTCLIIPSPTFWFLGLHLHYRSLHLHPTQPCVGSSKQLTRFQSHVLGSHWTYVMWELLCHINNVVVQAEFKDSDCIAIDLGAVSLLKAFSSLTRLFSKR